MTQNALNYTSISFKNFLRILFFLNLLKCFNDFNIKGSTDSMMAFILGNCGSWPYSCKGLLSELVNTYSLSVFEVWWFLSSTLCTDENYWMLDIDTPFPSSLFVKLLKRAWGVRNSSPKLEDPLISIKRDTSIDPVFWMLVSWSLSSDSSIVRILELLEDLNSLIP